MAQITLIALYVYIVVIFVSLVTVIARRLHDDGFSSLWLIIYFISNIECITSLILAMFLSKLGHNKYGPNPYRKNLDGAIDNES